MSKTIYTLSGDNDEDYFLDESDLGEHYDLLMGCYHQGQCEQSVNDVKDRFTIADFDKAREYLLSTGLDNDFDDDDEVLIYYLWILSGDMHGRE